MRSSPPGRAAAAARAQAPAHLDIDPHGRVIPDGDDARRALADRAGRFLLLPTAPDLVVARRTPATGGPVPRRRCVLAGDLAGFPIADFVAFVHQSRLSGVLTVSAREVERSLLFKDGEVRGARSTGSGERIGEVALRLGYVDARQLAEASQGGTPIGKALVERGFLTAADLWKCIHEQVTAVFHAVLLARDGVFALIEDPAVDLGSPLSMNTQSLLMDGIRRIDEMALFLARIPGSDAYVRRRQPAAPIALDRREEELLALVDGRSRVSTLARALHLGEFDAMKTLYHLAEAGYLETAPGPAPGEADPLADAVIAEFAAILRLVAAEVAAAGEAESFAAGVRTFLSDRAGRFAPLWSGLGPAHDGGIDPAALLRNLAALDAPARRALEPSGDPARLLLAAARELMFFYLFQAGELLPRDRDDRLGAEVKRRLAALGGPR